MRARPLSIRFTLSQGVLLGSDRVMLAYRDGGRRASTREELARIRRAAVGIGRDRDAALAVLIETGVLEAALLDAIVQARDDFGPLAAAARRAAIAAARSWLSCGRGETPDTARVAVALARLADMPLSRCGSLVPRRRRQHRHRARGAVRFARQRGLLRRAMAHCAVFLPARLAGGTSSARTMEDPSPARRAPRQVRRTGTVRQCRARRGTRGWIVEVDRPHSMIMTSCPPTNARPRNAASPTCSPC